MALSESKRVRIARVFWRLADLIEYLAWRIETGQWLKNPRC